jgi:hypothetical protein
MPRCALLCSNPSRGLENNVSRSWIAPRSLRRPRLPTYDWYKTRQTIFRPSINVAIRKTFGRDDFFDVHVCLQSVFINLDVDLTRYSNGSEHGRILKGAGGKERSPTLLNPYLRNWFYMRYTFQIFFNEDHFMTKSNYAWLRMLNRVFCWVHIWWKIK